MMPGFPGCFFKFGYVTKRRALAEGEQRSECCSGVLTLGIQLFWKVVLVALAKREMAYLWCSGVPP